MLVPFVDLIRHQPRLLNRNYSLSELAVLLMPHGIGGGDALGYFQRLGLQSDTPVPMIPGFSEFGSHRVYDLLYFSIARHHYLDQYMRFEPGILKVFSNDFYSPGQELKY